MAVRALVTPGLVRAVALSSGRGHLGLSADRPKRRRSCSSSCVRIIAMASPKKVLVPVADGTEEMEAVIVIDVLRRAGAHVTVASVGQEPKVTASRGVKLVADAIVSECGDEKYDLVVLPGGMPGAEHLRDSKALEDITRGQAQEQRAYAAICAAPAVALESWGLLNGLKATCYPSFVSKLSDPSSAESRVVKDGLVVTSRGPGTAMEFALTLVEQLYGKEKTQEVSKGLVGGGCLARFFSELPKFCFGQILLEGKPTKLEFNQTAWAAKVPSKPQVLVPIANGSEEMEAVIIIDVLRRAGMGVVVASVEETLQIVASRKVKIEADNLIGEVSSAHFDAIFLPGGMPGAEHLRDSKELQSILARQAKDSRVYGAICASPAVVLEANKILAGKKATAFPAFQSKLSDQSAVEARVVIDGLVATSQGPGTAMEFALAIVDKFSGKDSAVKTAEAMLFSY
ncbi:protein DJ-1 homolog A isoform X1 [Selaginella moellendorffii]|uniref:protein DJ-1 homolog A isoform X1 n=1 Tax=Selaginella moellendorffii TaxID=88036 RepID=UPI000D1CDC9F|nr:protein DJ-1 homolog A isoform X1 [Selaginella moellendorffii]|eukprot:XP_024541051.1 protein DJ-1 homolog A isoform X1 [Selaginella moellendorffii]